jgi:predicted RNA-binding Zn ribbon-like protein
MATLGNRRDERLPDPAALEEWLLAGGLTHARCRADMRDMARARSLRGALFGVVEAVLRGIRPAVADVETINAAAAGPTRVPRLAMTGDELCSEHIASNVSAILGEIARDAIDLLTGSQRSLLRECAADDCSGIYVDTSRGQTRRWCSTARCGNRARVAAHRARRRAGGETSNP